MSSIHPSTSGWRPPSQQQQRPITATRQQGDRPPSAAANSLQRRDWTDNSTNGSPTSPEASTHSLSPLSSHSGPYSAFLSQQSPHPPQGSSPMHAPRVSASAKGARPSGQPFVALPPATLPRPASTAASRFGALPPTAPLVLSSPTSVPPLSARSPVLLQRITSEESLSSLPSQSASGYSHSPALSEQGGDEEDSGNRSHTSSASSLSSQTTPQQRRAAAHVSPTSFLPPAGSSPRKRQDALHHSASASNSIQAPAHTAALSAPRGSPSSVSPVLPASSGSPLSQRYGLYGTSNGGSAISPSKQMMQPQQKSPQLQPQQPSSAQPQSARTLSSTSSSAHANSAASIKSVDLPPPSRSMPSAASKQYSNRPSGSGPVRAHHLAGSASASNMAAFLASGAESDSSAMLRGGGGGGQGVFRPNRSNSPPSNPTYNIWQRDTSANRTNGATTSKTALRPSSSHSAHRPVTARADLLSARDDSMSAAPAGKHPLSSSNPYAISYHSQQRPSAAAASNEPRMHTAAVNSLGAQARARSAHVLRPPSRQRPPNQALHLEAGQQPSPTAGAEGVAAASAVRASSALRASQWASSASGLSNTGPTGRPVSGGRSVHALHSSTDLFPAAPTQLVKAVKQQLRTMTAGGTRESASARSLHAALQSQTHDHHHANSSSSGGEPSGISGLMSSGGSGSSDYDSNDTDNTDAEGDGGSSSLETETDGGGDSTNTDEDTHASASVAATAGSFAGVDPSAFVSLHNILQLQSESVSKSIRLGSAGSSRKHLLVAAFPERPAAATAAQTDDSDEDEAHIVVESRVRTPASRSAHHSAHHSSGAVTAEDDPFPPGPHSRSSSMGSSRPNSRPGSARRGLSAGKSRR